MPTTPRFPRSESVLRPVLTALAQGTTVVTANKRTAAWLRNRYDAEQAAAGQDTWPTARAMPWTAWLRDLWLALRPESGAAACQLLTPWQEKRVWEQIVGGDAERLALRRTNAAALAGSAWEVAQGWQGNWTQWGGTGAREEHRTFVNWAQAFARECAARNWLDGARLPALLARALAEGRAHGIGATAFYGFAGFSPQQAALVEALQEAGVDVLHLGASAPACGDDAGPVRRRCADPADEWRRCAQWCRDWLAQAPDAALGVVIPDLAAQRPQVERVFREVLAPGSLLQGTGAALPINLSHAEPLAHQPLVAVALSLLQWVQSPLGAGELGALAHSPYLAGFDGEWPARAELARAVIEEPRDAWRPAEWAHFARAGCPAWAAQSAAIAALGADWRRRRSAREWRQAWDETLTTGGWLTEAALDSAEFQARGAWQDALDNWMRGESISGRMSGSEALQSLTRLMAETTFQPERGEAPVQILGTLEASGLHFDGLWICGLTAERWPPAPQPSPLLPLAWQRLAGAPHASAERELAYHRELTAQFAVAAPVVIFSWPAAIDGIPAVPSPLLAAFAPDPDALPAPGPSLAQSLLQPAGLLAWDDPAGIPVAGSVPGGAPPRGRVAVLEAQAACPFQAYTAFRLDAAPWPERAEGLTPAERGTLVHAALAAFWDGLPDQSALLELDSDGWTSRCAAAVERALGTLSAARWALLGEAFRGIERDRLLALLREWLDLEATRPWFAVEAAESKRIVTIDGLELRLKIDRLDRTADGQFVVIDFKTGQASIADLQRETRLIAPQLPLYVEALMPEVTAAVAYATVRRGESRVVGLAATSELWTALKPAEPDWPDLRRRWARQLRELVGEYRRGDAAVRPWRYPGTCDRCGRHALCRIGEHIAFVERDQRDVGDDDSAGGAT